MEASTQRDESIALFTEVYRPYGDGKVHILYVALREYDCPDYNLAVCARLLKTWPDLTDHLTKAYLEKSYKPLVDAVLNLSAGQEPHSSSASSASPSSLPPPVSIAPLADRPTSIPDSMEVSAAVHEIIDLILPSLREVVEPDWTWPSEWKPTKISDPEMQAWLSELKIPMLNGVPSLLLHRLGSLGDERMFSRLQRIFDVDRATLFINTSGSGKTRLLLEGLCQKWGFYFCTSTISDKVGSTDMLHSIQDRLRSTKGFTKVLPLHDFTALLEANRDIASMCIGQAILARFIVFRAFIDAIIASGRKITEDDKRLWVFLQVDPGLLGCDIFDQVARQLHQEGFSGPMCEERIRIYKDRLAVLIKSNFEVAVKKAPPARAPPPPPPLQPHNPKNMFHVVLDEAQYAATLFPEAFRSANNEHCRPVLREIIEMFIRLLLDGLGFTIGGTGIDKRMVEEMMNSVIAKGSNTERVSATGSFDKTDTEGLLYQKTYIRRYIPISIMKNTDGTGKRLLYRIMNWLDGRFRFTANFLTHLLDSDFKNPHQFLNDWVEFQTGFRPTDAPELTSPFSVTRLFRTKKLYDQINFAQIAAAQGIAEAVTTSVYDSLLRSGLSTSFCEEDNALVEFGFARYTTADCTTVCISEPLILLATTYYINENGSGQRPFGPSIWQYVVRGIGGRIDSKFNGFETYLAFLLADAFATPVPLKDVFEFASPAPEWADQSARLVALSRDPPQETRDGEPPSPPIRRTHNFNWREHAVPVGRIGETCNVEGTLRWLNHERQAAFCFPDNNMGPDILFVLELANKKLIWVALQAKFLADGIDNGPLKDAIRTTVPHKYFVQKSGEPFSKLMRPGLIEETREALTLAGGENTGTTYPLLRVVVVSPPTVGIDQLDAHIDDDAAALSDNDNHHDPGGHPLVALNWKRLLETTADRKERFLKVLTNPVERDPNRKRLPVKAEKKIKPAVEGRNGSKPVGEEKRKSSREEESVKKRRKTGPSNSTSTDVSLTQAKKNKSRYEGVGKDVGSLPDKNTSNSNRGNNAGLPQAKKTSKNDRYKSRDTSAYDPRGAQRGRQMGAGPGDAGPSRLFDHTRSASSSSPMRVDRDNLRARSTSRPQSSTRPSTPGVLGRGRDWEKDGSPRSVSAASSPPASRATTRTPGPAVFSPTVRRPFSPYLATEDEMGDSGSRKAELSSRLRR
ncbi:hypothetical protein C8R47DRAFT_1024034 [Mycena vitilis]|nr:hypothetical protein C8R47DRAFT_1024034 [Mycena vitilis]